jgi:short-subunit dehydrogenase
LDFSERVVVVTGASSGIGQATALAFARRGALVVAVARREERLARVVEACREHSPRSRWLAGDLGVRSFAEGVVADTVRDLGRLDVLVNNAAVPKHKQIYDVTADEVEQVMRVNFLSCVYTTLAAIPPMLAAGGGFLVNVSSVAGCVVPPREAVYAASKAALSAFTEGLWNDLEGSGIHACLVVPGAIDTEIWEKLEEPSAYRGPRVPPERVADAIVGAVVHRRHQVTVPRKLEIGLARLLHLAAPSLLRRGMRRMDPVPPAVVAQARERSRGRS